jgi:MYXO-CTERM domain-containing protein
MKKLLLLAALAGTVAGVYGQGSVVFNNTASAAYNVTTNDAFGGNAGLMSGAGRYRVGLYASTDLLAGAGSLSLVGLSTNIGIAGKFSGGSPFVLPNGYPTGTPIRFQLRGWSFAGGLSYEEAVTASLGDPLNIALGTSALGTTTPGGGPTPPGALFGTAPGQLTSGFVVAPVPEPSSIALGLLGLGAIALFRRRK